MGQDALKTLRITGTPKDDALSEPVSITCSDLTALPVMRQSLPDGPPLLIATASGYR